MIPARFALGGIEWNVEIVEAIPSDGEAGTYGNCNAVTRTITIAQTVAGHAVSLQEQGATFYHELIHAMLITTGYHELNEQEPFVTAMELMICEFLRSRA